MMTRGRGGGGGGLDTPKRDDIIYEQPLTGSKPEMLFENILRFGHVKFSPCFASSSTAVEVGPPIGTLRSKRKNLTPKWWVIFFYVEIKELKVKVVSALQWLASP